MAERNEDPRTDRPPDIEIGATARADRVRFHSKPDVRVRFRGRSIAATDEGSERHNLPDEVESGVTYRDVTAGWRAAAWVENAAEASDEPRGGSS